jgi:HJR/Mrr/RecB family endonuclease
MRLAEERRKPKRVDDISKIICYENIGKVNLYKTDICFVEIYDRMNNWMYTVYSFEESKAKNFIDALYSMMKSQ